MCIRPLFGWGRSGEESCLGPLTGWRKSSLCVHKRGKKRRGEKGGEGKGRVGTIGQKEGELMFRLCHLGCEQRSRKSMGAKEL